MALDYIPDWLKQPYLLPLGTSGLFRPNIDLMAGNIKNLDFDYKPGDLFPTRTNKPWYSYTPEIGVLNPAGVQSLPADTAGAKKLEEEVDTFDALLEKYSEFLNKLHYIPPGVRWMRSVGPIASGLQVFADDARWANNPDFGKANVISDGSGNYKYYRVPSLGQYKVANRRDPNIRTNLEDAIFRGTLELFSNLGNNPIGLMNANMFRYLNDTRGRSYQEGLDYNDKQDLEALTFNRQTDLQNMQAALEMAKLNASIDAQRYQAAKDYADAIDAATTAASSTRAANRKAFYENLSKLGQEILLGDAANVAAHMNPGSFTDYLYYSNRLPADWARALRGKGPIPGTTNATSTQLPAQNTSAPEANTTTNVESTVPMNVENDYKNNYQRSYYDNYYDQSPQVNMFIPRPVFSSKINDSIVRIVDPPLPYWMGGLKLPGYYDELGRFIIE